ncbi:MAG: hypothetical protein ABIG64_10020 [Candidatus Omnitrophota bacterium]
MQKKIIVNFIVFVLIQSFSLLNLVWADAGYFNLKNQDCLAPRIQITGSLLSHNYWQLSDRLLPSAKISQEKPVILNESNNRILKMGIFFTDFFLPGLALAASNSDLVLLEMLEDGKAIVHKIMVGIQYGLTGILFIFIGWFVLKFIKYINKTFIHPEYLFKLNELPDYYYYKPETETRLPYEVYQKQKQEAYIEEKVQFLLKTKPAWQKKNIINTAMSQLETKFRINFVIALRVLGEWKINKSKNEIFNSIIKVNRKFREESDYKLIFSVLNKLGVTNLEIIAGLQKYAYDHAITDLPASEAIAYFLINNYDPQIKKLSDFIYRYLQVNFPLNNKNKHFYDALSNELGEIKIKAFENFLQFYKYDFDWESDLLDRLERFVGKLKILKLSDFLKKINKHVQFEGACGNKVDLINRRPQDFKIRWERDKLFQTIIEMEEETGVGNNQIWLDLIIDYYRLSPEKAWEFVLSRLNSSNVSVVVLAAESMEKILENNVLNDIQKEFCVNKLADLKNIIQTRTQWLGEIKEKFDEYESELTELENCYNVWPKKKVPIMGQTDYYSEERVIRTDNVPIDQEAYDILGKRIKRIQKTQRKRMGKVTVLTKRIQVLKAMVKLLNKQLDPKNRLILEKELSPEVKVLPPLSSSQLITQSI